MLIISVVILVSLFVMFYFFKTSKEMPKNWYEWKTELRFQYIGAIGIIHDLIYASRDKVVLCTQPDRIAVITGGNRGIGLKIIEKLLACEMTVIMGCRDPKAGEKAVSQLVDLSTTKGKFICESLDVGELSSVMSFAKLVKNKYKKIDILINNAGIMFAPLQKTSEGFESHFAVNYLGHFFLTHLLMPQLKAAGSEGKNARVVNVSSVVNLIGRINYNDINGDKYYYPATAYNQSKLAQILATRHLNQMLREQNAHVEVFAVHPGVVDTDLFEYSATTAVPFLKKLIFKTPERGSRTIVYAAIDPRLEGKGGSYLSNGGKSPFHPDAKDSQKCAKLFKFSCDLLKITEYGNDII
ncbi:dehydrogenase/reductase SDR family member on chromosome X [Episyrphus balteatus]|uniref:dehydrogenase/reductase SDR family member on chromosome X n=1 Tax=Episyrphus balteatus TaxID=286459 RepID=UPI00248580EB|nr:dehydrogenase/reductase SDR family member on chromosome X [Episyrphus balteatus]XP_055837574.1 dehydrogenase/reductase SDR family member on chromosome X [Episyrphus balteatus]